MEEADEGDERQISGATPSRDREHSLQKNTLGAGMMCTCSLMCDALWTLSGMHLVFSVDDKDDNKLWCVDTILRGNNMLDVAGDRYVIGTIRVTPMRNYIVGWK